MVADQHGLELAPLADWGQCESIAPAKCNVTTASNEVRELQGRLDSQK
jgi:hypothetical protein